METMEKNQTSSQTSTSESQPTKPTPPPCVDCGSAAEQFLRPALLNDIPAKWMALARCTDCGTRHDAEEKLREQETAKKNRIQYLLKWSRLTPRLLEKSFANFDYKRLPPSLWASIRDYNAAKGSGLMLMGQCGTGKSHIASAITIREIHNGVCTLFISCPELLHEIRQTFSENKSPKPASESIFAKAQSADLLVLDDIGSEKPSEWVRETLFLLINHRYEHLKPIIFTTNCSLSELSERLGDRITSRIIEMCRLIEIKGDDYRVKIRKDSK